ncbi:MAG: GNAT family N-acetyltransferase [Halanaerobiales bacterium]|nr:GNAT family N-acetyltransferase [Halanaerobiales bacterium]
MRIRELRKEDLKEYAIINNNAYPGAKRTLEQTMEQLEKSMEYEHTQTFVAIDDYDKILGGLILLDFTIYQNYNELKMGGIGGVCVGLDSKKQGVAKMLVEDALQRMVEKELPISILYPFRHDFYQKMGWGQVGEVKEFKFPPSSLPVYPGRESVRGYRDSDLEGIKQCYEHFARSGNCTVKRTDNLWNLKMKHKPNIFVYEEDGVIQGYMQIGFDTSDPSFLKNDLKVIEMIYVNQHAYFGLLGFTASQLDQFDSVIYCTRRNDPFHHLLKEPCRDNQILHGLYHYSQKIGLGWMFRVLNVEKALMGRKNYQGANLEVTFEIEDSFLPQNSGSYTFVLNDGKPEVYRDRESANKIKLDISTFSQLYANYLTFSDAVNLGKAEVSDQDILSSLEKAFILPEPQMLEYF